MRTGNGGEWSYWEIQQKYEKAVFFFSNEETSFKSTQKLGRLHTVSSLVQITIGVKEKVYFSSEVVAKFCNLKNLETFSTGLELILASGLQIWSSRCP